MKRTTWGFLAVIAVVAYLAARSVGEPPVARAPEASEQWLVSASRRLTWAIRNSVARGAGAAKLAAHGRCRSALRSGSCP